MGIEEESKLIRDDSLAVDPNRRLSTGSAGGRKTPRLNAASPNFQKFDANLKKQLMAAER